MRLDTYSIRSLPKIIFSLSFHEPNTRSNDIVGKCKVKIDAGDKFKNKFKSLKLYNSHVDPKVISSQNMTTSG